MKGAIALLGITMLDCFFSTSSAYTTATYYTPPYIPSACYGFRKMGTRIAAASEALWDDGRACGRRYKVKCIGATNDGVLRPCTSKKSVIITITDLCPDPVCQGTIDLSQEVFEMIADPKAGKIKIDLIEIKTFEVSQ